MIWWYFKKFCKQNRCDFYIFFHILMLTCLLKWVIKEVGLDHYIAKNCNLTFNLFLNLKQKHNFDFEKYPGAKFVNGKRHKLHKSVI